MTDATSFLFSGLGAAWGGYRITNEMLAQLANAHRFAGVDVARVRRRADFAAWWAARPHLSEEVAAFCHFAESAGFGTRHAVYPYPEARRWRPVSVETAELAARAIEQALGEAGLTGDEVDAWVVSTTSVQGAPAVAALVKEYFVKGGNRSPTRSIQAGCGAFPLGLQTAREMMLADPALRHVVVAHTDVMSAYLGNQADFVRHMLFGDGAGAVVLSRVGSRPGEGLLAVVTAQDPRFMGHLGINLHHEVHHAPAQVRRLAVAGMADMSQRALVAAGLQTSDVDWFVPHQTGHTIVDETAQALAIPLERVERDVQRHYGNTSGSTVPIGLWHRRDELAPGQLVLGAAAGVGGDIGAFVYRMPAERPQPVQPRHLAGRRVLLTGASGLVGTQVLAQLLQEGAQVVALRRRHALDRPGVVEHAVDFTDAASVRRLVETLTSEGARFDALIHAAGGSESPTPALDSDEAELTDCMQLNFFAPVALTRALVRAGLLRGTVLYLGSGAEDFQVAGSSSYVAAKRALHGWAASASGEFRRQGVESLYVQLGLLQPDAGMGALLTAPQVDAVVAAWRQAAPLPAAEVARRLVRALWCAKVPGVLDTQEGAMTVRRDGYRFTPAESDR